MINDGNFKVRFFTTVIFMMIVSFGFSQNQVINEYFEQSAFNKRFENSSFNIHSSSLKKYPSLSQVFSFSEEEMPSFFSQPKAYSYHDLAFFCKVEVQIEKSTKVPFKFRLGDVRYVDYLEQKTDSPK